MVFILEEEMQIDTTEFPIVKMDYSVPYQTDFREILASLDELFARKTPFVIIGRGERSEKDEAQSKEDRHEAGLWAKARKEQIAESIMIHYYVESDPVKVLEMEEFSVIFEKFWGYPLVVVSSVEEGYRRAHALLNSKSGT